MEPGVREGETWILIIEVRERIRVWVNVNCQGVNQACVNCCIGALDHTREVRTVSGELN